VKKRELPVINISALPEGILEPLDKSKREERQDAAQNRQRILETARRLFDERGVEAVTMSEIAVQAGVGKGTLYRRYPDKGVLCMALVDQATQDFQNKVLAYLRGETIADNGNTLIQLSWILEQVVGYVEENAAYLKPSQEVGRTLHKKPYYNVPVYHWQRSLILLLLNAAAEAGEVQPDLDTDYLADALLAPLQLDLYNHHRKVRGFSQARIANGLKQLAASFFKQELTHP
jgi:AcrR family transcriptional regulator